MTNLKVTELTVSTKVVPEDLTHVVTDIVGTPINQSAEYATFLRTYNISTGEQASGLSNDDLDFRFDHGDVFRYGAVDDSASGSQGTDSLFAFQNAVDSGHPVPPANGYFSIEGTLLIDGGSDVQGGKTFVMTSNTRLERFSASINDPIIQVVGRQNYVNGQGCQLAARNVGGFTEGLLLVGVNPTVTDNTDATTGDMFRNHVKNFKTLGLLANTGFDRSVGFLANAASRKRGDWKTVNSCNVYYNFFSGITAEQLDFGIHLSSECSFNSLSDCSVLQWGRAAYSILGYGNQCSSLVSENPSSQDSTERFVLMLGTKNDPGSPETGTDDDPSATIAISGISAANPAVVTTSAVHGLTTEDKVLIKDVVDNGPDGDLETAVNRGHFQVIVLSTTTFSIIIDTSGLTNTYASGGTMQTDFLGNTGSFANIIKGSAEWAFGASTRNVRLMSPALVVGNYDVSDITGTFDSHMLFMQGVHPGGIGLDGFSTQASVGNSNIWTPAVQVNYKAPEIHHGFRFEELDDRSGSSFGTNTFKTYSRTLRNLAESTPFDIININNVGPTTACMNLMLRFAGKESANGDVHVGEISWLLPVTGGSQQTAIKYKDFQGNENDENATWSITESAGTQANSGQFQLVLTTGNPAGTGNFFYTWWVDLVPSELEGDSGLTWNADVTIQNGGQ